MHFNPVLIFLFCVFLNTAISQEIIDLKCREYIKYDVVAKKEDDCHIGRVYYTTSDDDWNYNYGALISDKFVITKAYFVYQHNISKLYFQHKDTEFDIVNVYANPLFTGDFKHHDIALLELSETKRNFRFACIWTEKNIRPIQSKSAFLTTLDLSHVTEYSTSVCHRASTAVNASHTCIDPLDFLAGSPIQYKIDDVIYIKSVFAWYANDEDKINYRVGINLLPYIDWIERTVWPELYYLRRECEFNNFTGYIDDRFSTETSEENIDYTTNINDIDLMDNEMNKILE